MSSYVAPIILFFFFNDTATTEIYTLSLHDALPISPEARDGRDHRGAAPLRGIRTRRGEPRRDPVRARHSRSEEHTSELQSQSNLVCRLLLEKKKRRTTTHTPGARQTPLRELVTGAK